MLLTEDFEDCFEFEGRILHVDMRFDNILKLFEMFDDEAFHDAEKILIGLRMMVREYWVIEHRTYDEQYALFCYVMKEFLDIDLEAPAKQQKKVMDYQKDAELIYASFFAVYKMDLFELRGKLHWNKFQALLTHLQDESPLKQVIGYRTMKVPDAKNSSKEHREHVQKMKRIHALEQSEEEQAESISQAFDTIAQAFKGGR